MRGRMWGVGCRMFGIWDLDSGKWDVGSSQLKIKSDEGGMCLQKRKIRQEWFVDADLFCCEAQFIVASLLFRSISHAVT